MLSQNSMKLTNKIVIQSVGYMIIIMFLFSCMIYMVDKKSTHEMGTGMTLDMAKTEAKMVDLWLNDTILELNNLSTVICTDNMDIMNHIEKLKVIQQNNTDRFRHLYLINRDREYVDTFDQSSTMSDELVEQLFNGERDYVITSPKNHPILSEALMNMIVPIKHGEEVVGVLGATVTMDQLSKRLEAFRLYGSGFGWLIDENYTVIAFPDTDKILSMSLYSTKQLEDLGSSKDIESAKEYGYVNMDIIPQHLMEENQYTGSYTDADGYNRTVAFFPVKSMKGWFVGFTGFDDKMPNPTRNLVIYMGIALLLIILASIGVAYVLANELAKPINQLIQVANLFIKGNKGVRADIKTSDEIGTLGQAFNEMADKIIEQTDNVEELIKERTSMLADLNYQIVLRNQELNTMNEELETTNTKLHSLATTDMLTGLQNRHELIRMMQTFIDEVLREDTSGFSVLFVDLDNFKYYNDTFSHEIGDFILKEVSKILQNNVRDLDLVARYGGDEFVILLKHSEYETAKMISERIHAKILERKGFRKEIENKIGAQIMLLGKNMLSCSIGIVNYNRTITAKTAEELLALADDTMYKAKKAGKSRIVVN